MAAPRTSYDWQALSYEAMQLFSPSAPVDESDLFAGRSTQLARLIEVVLERGKHAVLYGERGVGETSLARVFHLLFPSIVRKVMLVREQVDPSDNFSTVWRKVFKDIELVFTDTANESERVTLSEIYDNDITPDDVRRALEFSF